MIASIGQGAPQIKLTPRGPGPVAGPVDTADIRGGARFHGLNVFDPKRPSRKSLAPLGHRLADAARGLAVGAALGGLPLALGQLTTHALASGRDALVMAAGAGTVVTSMAALAVGGMGFLVSARSESAGLATVAAVVAALGCAHVGAPAWAIAAAAGGTAGMLVGPSLRE